MEAIGRLHLAVRELERVVARSSARHDELRRRGSINVIQSCIRPEAPLLGAVEGVVARSSARYPALHHLPEAIPHSAT
jgi:hypothetical protein